LRLLRKKPLGEITVSELCREAGLNRATFYRHYSVPKDVLTEIEVTLLGEFRHQMKSAEHPADLAQFLEEFCEYLRRHAEEFRFMFHSHSDEDFIALLNTMLSEGIPDPGKRWGNPDEAERRLLTAFFAGGGYFLIKYWLLEIPTKKPEEIAALLLRILNCIVDETPDTPASSFEPKPKDGLPRGQ
ncbi:MAG: TetR/AcrR family transcriptional regulator, partial [Eubacteriales bacterium]